MYQFKRQILRMTFQEKMDLIDAVRKEAGDLTNTDNEEDENILLDARTIFRKLSFDT